MAHLKWLNTIIEFGAYGSTLERTKHGTKIILGRSDLDMTHLRGHIVAAHELGCYEPTTIYVDPKDWGRLRGECSFSAERDGWYDKVFGVRIEVLGAT